MQAGPTAVSTSIKADRGAFFGGKLSEGAFFIIIERSNGHQASDGGYHRGKYKKIR